MYEKHFHCRHCNNEKEAYVRYFNYLKNEGLIVKFNTKDKKYYACMKDGRVLGEIRYRIIIFRRENHYEYYINTHIGSGIIKSFLGIFISSFRKPKVTE